MEIRIISDNKSIKASNEVITLPNFCVLTGINGSGKSHFLETLSNAEKANVDDNEKRFSEIKYIRFGELNPNINPDSNYENIIQQAKYTWNEINRNLEIYKRDKATNPYSLIENYIGDYRIKKIAKSFEKQFPNIEEWTEDFFITHLDLNLLTEEQFFSTQFATVFKVYYNRMLQNFTMDTLNQKYNTSYKVLVIDEFEALYGPKPWDLINQMMENAHLPYIVNNPEGETPDSVYHLYLTDSKKNIKINVNDLSTGEKVLMSLAIAIYNTAEQGIKPDLLLLDEPDAPLHPEFSKFLMDTIKYSIVEKAGVNVIITTHSPTTVAMADEDSLFKMNKDKGIPEKISKSAAISLLTRSLDGVRISLENRRQIFVESKYDVQYYTKIYNLINDLSHEFDLKFVEASQTSGCNCDDVETMTKALRIAGNNFVYGIVDNDGKKSSTEFVFVAEERYSIENYLFDPIFIGFLLIRERICKGSDLLIKDYSYVQLQNITHVELQKMIESIEAELKIDPLKNIVEYQVLNGEKFQINKDFFTLQGHELEQKLIALWPQLQAISKGRSDNLLKNYIIDNVINDYPYYISKALKELFENIYSACRNESC